MNAPILKRASKRSPTPQGTTYKWRVPTYNQPCYKTFVLYRTITIEGYRCFERLELDNLAPVNLLVGQNNSGKTSVLEAVTLLASKGQRAHLADVSRRRGETTWRHLKNNVSAHRPQAKHLFFNHRAEIGAVIQLLSTNETIETSVQLSIEPHKDPKHSDVDRAIIIRRGDTEYGTEPITPQGYCARFVDPSTQELLKPLMLRPSTLNAWEVITLATELQLTPTETLALEALQTVAPEVEQFRPKAGELGDSEREGIIVKLRNLPEPVPIGSLGDGAWRILAIALALGYSSNNVLLIDEVDAGLHYSVMVDLWRLILKATEQLNVQVFATSHSRDCIEALAAVTEELPPNPDRARIHRVSPSSSKAVTYDQSQMIAATEQGYEVR